MRKVFIWQFKHPPKTSQLAFLIMRIKLSYGKLQQANCFKNRGNMSNWQDELSNLVYSTESGKITPEKETEKLVGEQYSDGMLRIARQTKGRKGKGVILISGLQLSPAEFKKLAQTIKKKCGMGGAVKDGVIEIQGDDREKVKTVLESLNYRCKLAGG